MSHIFTQLKRKFSSCDYCNLRMRWWAFPPCLEAFLSPFEIDLLAHRRGAMRSRGVRRPLTSIVRRPLAFCNCWRYWPETLYICNTIGKSNSQTKLRSSLILGLATRGPKPKTQTILGLLNKWLDHLQIVIIGKYNKDTWHNIGFFYLTYFWKSQRSRFKTLPLLARFVTIWLRTL
jgi:hypothetical protein